jgi:predicted nucleic acid-binding protein
VKWLLDTNVLSESIRPRPNRAISRWLAAQPSPLTAISIVTLAELQHGTTSADSETHRETLGRWLATTVIPSFHERTLPLTSEILVDWLELARQLAGRRITRAAPDVLIAATARIHNLTVVTRNVRDFADTGVVVYDPWNDQTHSMDPP